MEGERLAGDGAIVYCVVPRELEGRLFDPLREHFRDDPAVEVVIASDVGDPDPATISDLGALEKKLDSVDRDLDEVTDAAASSSSDVTGVAGDLNALNRNVDDLKIRLRQKGNSIQQLSDDVAKLQEQIEPVARFVQKREKSES